MSAPYPASLLEGVPVLVDAAVSRAAIAGDRVAMAAALRAARRDLPPATVRNLRAWAVWVGWPVRTAPPAGVVHRLTPKPDGGWGCPLCRAEGGR